MAFKVVSYQTGCSGDDVMEWAREGRKRRRDHKLPGLLLVVYVTAREEGIQSAAPCEGMRSHVNRLITPYHWMQFSYHLHVFTLGSH